MDLDSVLVHEHSKRNLDNIQPSWPHTWSITHIKPKVDNDDDDDANLGALKLTSAPFVGSVSAQFVSGTLVTVYSLFQTNFARTITQDWQITDTPEFKPSLHYKLIWAHHASRM